jgi:hypothetical protein
MAAAGFVVQVKFLREVRRVAEQFVGRSDLVTRSLSAYERRGGNCPILS